MSKYTVELRYICETEAGLLESKGNNSINDIIDKSVYKIFNFDFPIFDEQYKLALEKKIIRHYYTREIGLETVGLWKMKLETAMNEIMPYYNQRYKSALLTFNPLYDVDTNRSHNTKSDSKRNDVTNTTANVVSSSTGNNYQLTSDTPQGSLKGIDDLEYMSEARKDIIGENNNNDSTMNSKVDSGVNNTEEYIEIVRGKQGTQTYSKMLTEFRETFLNIDMEVIESLRDLFMLLW